MKKQIFSMAVMAVIFAACGGGTKTPVTVVGSWVMPIEGVDTLKIDKLTPDSLVLSSNYGYTLEYVRQK